MNAKLSNGLCTVHGTPVQYVKPLKRMLLCSMKNLCQKCVFLLRCHTNEQRKQNGIDLKLILTLQVCSNRVLEFFFFNPGFNLCKSFLNVFNEQ